MFGMTMSNKVNLVLSHFVLGVLPELGLTLQNGGPRDQCELPLAGVVLLKDHLDLQARPLHFRCSLIVQPPFVAPDRRSDLEVRFVIKVLFMENHPLIRLLLTIGDLDDSTKVHREVQLVPVRTLAMTRVLQQDTDDPRRLLRPRGDGRSHAGY